MYFGLGVGLGEQGGAAGVCGRAAGRRRSPSLTSAAPAPAPDAFFPLASEGETFPSSGLGYYLVRSG